MPCKLTKSNESRCYVSIALVFDRKNRPGPEREELIAYDWEEVLAVDRILKFARHLILSKSVIR